MASIVKRKNSDGTTSYRAIIRLKNHEVYRTFDNEEDAKLFSFYKERLIKNMKAFEVPIKERISLRQIFELKESSLPLTEKRARAEFTNAFEHVSKYLKEKAFVMNYSFEEWLNAAKAMINMDIYRGAKTRNGSRKISISSLRRYFACASSAFSHAISMGIEIENFPLKVLQSYINPLMKDHSEPA